MVAGRCAVEALVTVLRDWRGRRVLVTGHTGFKGSWLSLWLAEAGAEVTGLALPASTDPSLFEAARIGEIVDHRIADIRDMTAVQAVFADARPEVVFHLAAQPLVRLSYQQPVETYATNIMGTAHVLEAARQAGSVEAIVCVTSDKCYDNREWAWAYRESDPLGGHDPYSSSKGCAELVAAAYRSSYFDAARAPERWTGLATARAGNVIGGGDWAEDRLIPDVLRALSNGNRPLIRAPKAVRPWQHVLEALHGYILVAERLLAGERRFAQGWNFGPFEDDMQTVETIVDHLVAAWGGKGWDIASGDHPHEAAMLRLDSSKARAELGWRPVLGLTEALNWIMLWHQGFAAGADARDLTLDQIRVYAAMSQSHPTALVSKAVA